METVLITGASGLVGSRLTNLLLQKNYMVIHLSRPGSLHHARVKTYNWDVNQQTIDLIAVEQADYIIHLAGEGIADKRWSAERKQKIIESRSQSTALLFNAITKSKKQLKAFITASAVGYYGAVTSTIIFKEMDFPGTDFLANTCITWENSADKIAALGVRTVKIRTALVLSAKGGALQKMAKPIRYYIGSPLGSGKQYMPWIHIDDLCRIYIKAIEDEQLHGPYNASTPEFITNKQFIVTLAKALHRPILVPNVPEFALKLVLGEMACLVLEGSRVSAEKISQTGFTFHYPTLEMAMKHIVTNG